VSATPEQLPPASLFYFMAQMATQARIALGVIENPVTREVEQNLQSARLCIDLLEVLREKTEGNRTQDESRVLDETLADLRDKYAQAAG